MTGFTPQQIEMFRERFQNLDIASTGELDRTTVAEILGSEAGQLDQLMTCLLFEQYDINKNGTIDFDEFIQFCTEMDDLTERGILRRIFNLCDTDHSGALDVDEVKRLGESMGKDVTTADAWATIAALDSNNDNQIDFSEFCSIIGG